MHTHYMRAQTHKVIYYHRDLRDWEVLKPLGGEVWREGIGDTCALITAPQLLPPCYGFPTVVK